MTNSGLKAGAIFIVAGIAIFLVMSAILPSPLGRIIGGLVGFGVGFWGIIFGIMGLLSSSDDRTPKEKRQDTERRVQQAAAVAEAAGAIAELFADDEEQDQVRTVQYTQKCPECDARWNVNTGRNVNRFSKAKLQCDVCSHVEYVGREEYPMDN